MSENSGSVQKHITSATIYDIREIILGRKTKPVFVITIQRGDDTSHEITKEYKDFFDLQCSILDTFPLEGGQAGYSRVIPYLPGRRIFRKDNLHLAQERKSELNKYMSELLKLNKNISQSKLVLDFFAMQDIPEDDKDEGKVIDEIKSDMMDLQHCYVNTSYNSDEEQQSNA